MLSGNEFLPSVSHSLASFLSFIRHILYSFFSRDMFVISIFHYFSTLFVHIRCLFVFFYWRFDIVCGAVSQFAKCHVATFSSFRRSQSFFFFSPILYFVCHTFWFHRLLFHESTISKIPNIFLLYFMNFNGIISKYSLAFKIPVNLFNFIHIGQFFPFLLWRKWSSTK